MKNKICTLHPAFAYALPVMPVSFLAAPLAILQAMYVKYFGLELSVITAVLLLSRLFDAVSDPLVGYLSDRYCARGGSRKPFVAVGGVLLLIASWFLFVPPENVSAGYFLFWFLAFYFSYTLIEIPHITWGGELASAAHEKIKCTLIAQFYYFWVFCCISVCLSCRFLRHRSLPRRY